MQRSFFTIAAVVFFIGTSFTSCDTPKDDVAKAQQDVVDAHNRLEEATDDYLADIEKFRAETNDRIAVNERTIADLKAGMENQNAATKSDYWGKIAELEKKNSELKIRIVNYKADGKDNWNTFKTEFNHDMDGLGSAFRDISVKNSNN